MADIARALKAFRPAQTVLEAQLAPARRGEGAGSTSVPGLTAALGPDGGFVDVMAQKRNQHQSAIQVRPGRSPQLWLCVLSKINTAWKLTVSPLGCAHCCSALLGGSAGRCLVCSNLPGADAMLLAQPARLHQCQPFTGDPQLLAWLKLLGDLHVTGDHSLLQVHLRSKHSALEGGARPRDYMPL